MPKWSLEQEAKFILDNWLRNPCGQTRSKKVCENVCSNWTKKPVKNDGYFSECYMQERTRRLIKNLLKELESGREKDRTEEG